MTILLIGKVLYSNIQPNKKTKIMKKSLLVFDAVINFTLGILLIMLIPFPDFLPTLLGVPVVEYSFYPSIMGGVFIGIGISLLIEVVRHTDQDFVGLGLGGAISINLSGGLVLIGWLAFGNLSLPLKGKYFLWTIAILLVGISSLEFISHLMQKSKTAA